jgi:hypothetical protein
MKLLLPLGVLASCALLIPLLVELRAPAGERSPLAAAAAAPLARDPSAADESSALRALPLRDLVSASTAPADDGRRSAPDYSLSAAIEVLTAGWSTAPTFEWWLEGPLGTSAGLLRGEAAADGTFTQALAGPGRYVLRAAARGYLCPPEWFELTPQAPLAEVRLSAEAGLLTSGVVLDGHGRPTAGAEVLATEGRTPLSQQTTTGPDGAFELCAPAPRPGVAPGLLALAAGHAPLHVPLESQTEGLELVLDRGWTLRGTVVDVDGTALVGATVRWQPRNSPGPRLSAWIESQAVRTADDGTFVLPGVQPGAVQVTASAEGCAPATARVLPTEQERPLRLVLGASTELAGRVLFADGTPAEGAELELTDLERRAAPQRSTSDVEGRFHFAATGRGSHRLSATAPGAAPTGIDLLLPSADPLELVLGESAHLAGDLWLDRPTRYSVALATLDGRRLRTEFFEVPRFELLDAIPGEYLVLLDQPGQPLQELGPVVLVAGAVTELGTVGPAVGAGLRGTVIDAESGEPLTAALTLFRELERDSGTLRAVTTAQVGYDGRFELTGLAAGHYQLYVRPDHGAPLSLEGLTCDGRSVVDLGLLEIETAASVVVQVLGERGEPLGGVALSLSDERTGYARRTDELGQVRVDHLLPGPCSAALLLDGVPYAVHGEAQAGTTTQLRLCLAELPVTSWSAQLVDGQGAPLSGCSLRAAAQDLAWTSSEATTDAAGRFELRGLLTGAAVLQVHGLRPDYEALNVELTFPEAGRGPATVALPGGAIRGRFAAGRHGLRLARREWSEGQGPPFLRALGAAAGTVRGAPGASFELGHLAPGTYGLDWLDERGEVAGTLEFELAADEVREL